jgi:hypothetical protein
VECCSVCITVCSLYSLLYYCISYYVIDVELLYEKYNLACLFAVAYHLIFLGENVTSQGPWFESRTRQLRRWEDKLVIRQWLVYIERKEAIWMRLFACLFYIWFGSDAYEASAVRSVYCCCICVTYVLSGGCSWTEEKKRDKQTNEPADLSIGVWFGVSTKKERHSVRKSGQATSNQRSVLESQELKSCWKNTKASSFPL